jgi:hypothetical protein
MAKFDLFGFTITTKEEKDKEKQKLLTFAEPSNPDAALEIEGHATGHYGYGLSFNPAVENEIALVTQYRDLALQPEVEKAIDDIINEVFYTDEDEVPVSLNMDEVKGISAATKKKVEEEFQNILEMLNFKNDGYEIFRRWYVDGRVFYHKVIDGKDTKAGIKELRYVDPRKIRKIREKIKINKDGTPIKASQPLLVDSEINTKYDEYYIYNPQGINTNNPQGLRVSTDSIVFVHSGVYDKSNASILSHLHKAIRYFNILRHIEDAMVIYRLTRAPDRRVFNVEIGNLPKQKADQYLKETINKFKNKIVYDAQTGKVRSDNKFVTMLEDYWFPKRDGKGTTVDTLGAGESLQNLDDVDHFKQKLYESLNVPVSRLANDATFNIGRSSEITRDEVKFAKFIVRLRKRFSQLFEDCLRTQLILKGIMSDAEFEDIRQDMFFDFLKDNMFAELKEAEIWNSRLALYQQAKEMQMDGHVSKGWIRRNMLKITDEEFDEMADEIEEDKQDMQDQAEFQAQLEQGAHRIKNNLRLPPSPPPPGAAPDDGPA